MARVSQNISLGFGILHQILPHDLFFVQNFHSIEVSSRDGLLVFSLADDVQFFHYVNLAERALTQLGADSEVIGTDFLLLPVLHHVLFLFFSLIVLVSVLPELDELLFPAGALLLLLFPMPLLGLRLLLLLVRQVLQ